MQTTNLDQRADRNDAPAGASRVPNARGQAAGGAEAESTLSNLLAVDIDLANVLEGFYHPYASEGRSR